MGFTTVRNTRRQEWAAYAIAAGLLVVAVLAVIGVFTVFQWFL